MEVPRILERDYISEVLQSFESPKAMDKPNSSSPLTSSICAPGISLMDDEFHNSSTILSTLTVSIFVLGFSV